MAESASLRLELIEKMATLATGGLGFVAGLAWNDAIQSAFALLFPTAGNVLAKFLYALLITAIVVYLTTRLSRAAGALKAVLDKEKKVDEKKVT